MRFERLRLPEESPADRSKDRQEVRGPWALAGEHAARDRQGAQALPEGLSRDALPVPRPAAGGDCLLSPPSGLRPARQLFQVSHIAHAGHSRPLLRKGELFLRMRSGAGEGQAARTRVREREDGRAVSLRRATHGILGWLLPVASAAAGGFVAGGGH